ncbi:acetyltransferase [Brunnivagina elsteri]|uniref:Sugar O-acyltransferase n=1 Tax=Brunnivagina elsteri CCALA 953 TaxID=987040 RepID=A0A2A2TNA0_9CYAN|nr:acetyltransferase [Calothrix elsteri]PAX60016.1 sugar O-acyltransferase [Calothrix elsteri CCALA 953]
MDIYLYGCGGHAKVISDILCKQGRKVAAFIDDNPPVGLTLIHGIPVKKSSPEVFAEINCDRSQWIVAIGNNPIRRRVAEKLEKDGYSFTTAIHPSVEMACDVKVGCGTVIMPNSVVNTDTEVGSHVIVNTGSTIDHDCRIGDYCHIAPGCRLCGNIHLDEGVFLGVGTKIIPGIQIGEYTTCGAGSVVVKSLSSFCLAYGCPAKVVQNTYSQ